MTQLKMTPYHLDQDHQVEKAGGAKMSASQHLEEKTVLRWGGFSGLLGGLILIIVFFIVGIFVGADPSDLEGYLTRWPNVRAARTWENSLYLLALILFIPSFIALFYTLRAKFLAPALFGTVLAILGLLVMSASALPHIPSVRMAEVYYAPGTSAVDQATIVHMWQLMWGTFEAMLYVGLVFLPLGLILLAVAMFKSPDFGPLARWLTLILGIAGCVAAVIFLINPASSSAAVSVIGLIFFHVGMGRKLVQLSNGRAE